MIIDMYVTGDGGDHVRLSIQSGDNIEDDNRWVEITIDGGVILALDRKEVGLLFEAINLAMKD